MIRDNYPTFPGMSGERCELTYRSKFCMPKAEMAEGEPAYLGIRLPWESHIHLVIKSTSHWKEGGESRFGIVLLPTNQ